MSARGHNPGPELATLPPPLRTINAAANLAPLPAGHEALQALLAFSALHEQVRQRRARESGKTRASNPTEIWEVEQFVLDEVLQLVADRALAITGADGIAIAIAEDSAIVCRASAGTIAPDPGARLDPHSGFSGACLRSGVVVRCDDSEVDSRVNVQACRRLGTRSMVAVPLSARDSVIGLLEAFSTEAYGFNDCDVRSLNLLAELILSALKPEDEDRLAEIARRVVPPPEAPRDSFLIPSQARPELSPAEGYGTAAPALIAEPIPDHPPSSISRPGLHVVFALILVAAAAGVILWRKIDHKARVATPAVQPTTATPAASLNPGTPPPIETALDVTNDQPASPHTTGLPHVTGIRHWSSADSSTVVVDLQDQVQYEAHRLPNPDRIYFDLHDTTLSSAISGKTIDVDDSLLQRIRVAQPADGITRVVLETKNSSDFSVSLEPNPYRLVVEVRKVGTKPLPRTRVDLFAPQRTPPLSPNAHLAPAQATPVSSLMPPPLRAPNFRIVLDAGHGGWDLGTVGRKGLLEKDLVMDIVDRLGQLVQGRLNAQVIFTRLDDNYIPLEKRAEIANQSKANLFLSIHANYSDFPSARGVETYYTNTYSSVHARTAEADKTLQNVSWTNVDIRAKVMESRRFASSVQHSLYGVLSARTAGLRDRGVKEAQYVVLTGTSMPAILAEVSFVSSPTDESNLQSSAYRQQIAEALYKGIARYASQSAYVKLASASPRKVTAR